MEKLKADIQRAIADVRYAARIDNDEAGSNVADWFDGLFVDAVTRQDLRSAAKVSQGPRCLRMIGNRSF